MASLPDGETKRKVILGCTSCHQLGTPAALRNSKEEWRTTVKKMMGIDDKLKLHLIPLKEEDLVDWLAKYATGPLEKMNIPVQTDVKEAPAEYREYPVGAVTGFYHDMALAGGKAWIADYFGNKLYGVDLQSGATESIAIPVNVPEGKPGGAHAIDNTADGKLWITFTKSEQIMEFDPAAKTFRVYNGFTPDGNVQYFVLDAERKISEDKEGHIWVSHFSKEILSRVNRLTGKISVFQTQKTPNMNEAAVHLYAAVTDSKGRLWYTETHGNHYGFMDPATGKTWERPMQTAWAGPKRLAIDKDDRLWIPELATGTIRIYDTRSDKFVKVLNAPIRGDYLYAIRRNPYTGDMWVNGSGSDSLYRIDPVTFNIRIYRLPRRGAFTRTVAFSADGFIWTSYAAFPNKHTAMPHENGVILRLKPVD